MKQVVDYFTDIYIYYLVNTQPTGLSIKNIMVNMADLFPGSVEFII